MSIGSTERQQSARSAVTRRGFLAGITLASLIPRASIAGPFTESDFETLVRADKHLRPEWTKSLFERGEPAVHRKSRGELRFIGMPVGGICCGTLYLGGDGQLWLWDIFNDNRLGIMPRSVNWESFHGPRMINPLEGANYVEPLTEDSPLEQGFAIRIGQETRPLNASGWAEVTFTGQYPVGMVRYADSACPVEVRLTAYSPFIAGNADDSGLPATLMEYTLHNTGSAPLKVEIAGWMQNACSLKSAEMSRGHRVNEVQRRSATVVESRYEVALPEPDEHKRPDIVIDDFEHEGYGAWRVEGDAFGAGPVKRSDVPGYQGNLGGEGDRVVNSHASAPGTDVGAKDSRTGMLTSPPFTIERRFLTFYIGGGNNLEEVGLRLIVDGKTARRATGANNNHMEPHAFQVEKFEGKQATIQIYDNGRGGWGNIGVDQIMQSDHPAFLPHVEQERDFGTMAIGVLGNGIGLAQTRPEAVFTDAENHTAIQAGSKLIGAVRRDLSLGPGQSQTVTFVVAWNFPNSGLRVPDAVTGNYYAHRFKTAGAVAEYVAAEYPRLSHDTKLWQATWNDTTLPHWFMDRTFTNTCILATSTAHRFGSGRFWGWEGIGCCEGTCCHVWHYAQAVGRIFPEIERNQREHVDFGVAFNPQTGQIGYRGENTGPAVDGQCGRILGVYREHQMSADSAFLTRIWPHVRLAMEFLMRYDHDGDGLLEGAQDNTLDAAWYGKIAWLSSLYAAALLACVHMATEVGDTEFAAKADAEFRRAKHAIETELFNGEYFIQKPEPGKEKTLGTYETCHIDQVHGQSWAWQVALERVLDRDKTLTALRSLYKYNFAPDVGPFRHKNWPGRAYALAGEGGLIMATNPKEIPHAFGNQDDWQYGYFNECMSGFEHQAASHMIAEGLVLEGLAVTRAIHDRYHASRRNPYNEVECSDHYSRAMASFGSFITLCGFEYHGPKGHIGFAPRVHPEKFRAPFTAAEGWGTFSQEIQPTGLQARVAVRHGQLRLRTIALAGSYSGVKVQVGGKMVGARVNSAEGRALVTLDHEVVIPRGEEMAVSLTG
jgi:uncharacterized protein (DUF608 family)